MATSRGDKFQYFLKSLKRIALFFFKIKGRCPTSDSLSMFKIPIIGGTNSQRLDILLILWIYPVARNFHASKSYRGVQFIQRLDILKKRTKYKLIRKQNMLFDYNVLEILISLIFVVLCGKNDFENVSKRFALLSMYIFFFSYFLSFKQL